MGELGYLEASDNQLSTIAQNISRLWKLHTLLLAANNLQDLPLDIELLENVKVVDVFGNKLCVLSDEQKKWLTARQRQWEPSQRCQ
jgi:Leucine-rich repeat (LRR) protein